MRGSFSGDDRGEAELPYPEKLNFPSDREATEDYAAAANDTATFYKKVGIYLEEIDTFMHSVNAMNHVSHLYEAEKRLQSMLERMMSDSLRHDNAGDEAVSESVALQVLARQRQDEIREMILKITSLGPLS